MEQPYPIQCPSIDEGRPTGVSDPAVLKAAEMEEIALRTQRLQIASVLHQQILIAHRRSETYIAVTPQGVAFLNVDESRSEAEMICGLTDRYMEVTAPEQYPSDEE